MIRAAQKAWRRTHLEIRRAILDSMDAGKIRETGAPIRWIAQSADTNWFTAERHLNFLKGRGLVEETFSFRTLRLFRLTGAGADFRRITKNNPDIGAKAFMRLMRLVGGGATTVTEDKTDRREQNATHKRSNNKANSNTGRIADKKTGRTAREERETWIREAQKTSGTNGALKK
mgnify:CR=1 FL=1